MVSDVLAMTKTGQRDVSNGWDFPHRQLFYSSKVFAGCSQVMIYYCHVCVTRFESILDTACVFMGVVEIFVLI